MNKKVKILVSTIIIISIVLLAAFTSKINSANKGIKIEDPGTLYVGGIANLIISPEDGSSITEEEIENNYTYNKWLWSSSDEKVIMFSNQEEENAITAVGAGTATITVIDEDGGYSGEVKITIPEPKVSFEEKASTIYDSTNGFIVNKGGNQALTLKIENLATDYTVEWVVSDETVLKVIDNDSVEALSSGVATVKAILHTSYGDWETDEVKITVVSAEDTDGGSDSGTNDKQDTSTSASTLPYTGFENLLKIAIVIVALSGIAMFILYKKYYEIK